MCFFVGRACSLGGYLSRYHLMGRRTFFPWLCFFQHGVPLKHTRTLSTSLLSHMGSLGLQNTRHLCLVFVFEKNSSALMAWVLLLITVELFTVGVDGVDGTHPTFVLFFLEKHRLDFVLFLV